MSAACQKLMTIRTFKAADMETVMNIQNEAPTAARWRSADYARLVARPGGMILVAEADIATPPATTEGAPGADLRARFQTVGFAVASQAADEAELKNIVVRPAYRRRGVGKALLGELHQRLLDAGANRVYLEVRPSNIAAVELYRSLGYSVRYERKKYYQDPPEDALVLSLELLPDEV